MGNPGKFQPGQSGNPGGRPKKIPAWVARFRAGEPDALKFVLEMVKGEVSDARPGDRLKAVELLFAYSRGKPRGSIELTGADGGPVRVSTGEIYATLTEIEAKLTEPSK